MFLSIPTTPKPSPKALSQPIPTPGCPPGAPGRTWWSNMSSRVHFTLTSPGRFTWKPSVSWVVGIRCHCQGQGDTAQAGPLPGTGGHSWAGALGRGWHSHTAWGTPGSSWSQWWQLRALPVHPSPGCAPALGRTGAMPALSARGAGPPQLLDPSCRNVHQSCSSLPWEGVQPLHRVSQGKSRSWVQGELQAGAPKKALIPLPGTASTPQGPSSSGTGRRANPSSHRALGRASVGSAPRGDPAVPAWGTAVPGAMSLSPHTSAPALAQS